MKKIMLLLTLFIMSIWILSIDNIVKADIGPKPSSTFILNNIPDDIFYFDLLIPKPEYISPLTDDDWDSIDSRVYYRSDFPRYVEGFIDQDDYVSFTLYTSIPHQLIEETGEVNQLVIKTGYISCPTQFKIAFYTSEGVILTSEILTRSYFTSRFSIDLDGIDFSTSTSFNSDYVETDHTVIYNNIIGNVIPSVIDESFDIWIGTINFLLRLTTTIIVELMILYLFMYRSKRTYFITSITNFVTQALISILFLLLYYLHVFNENYLLYLLVFEFIVFFIEIYVYMRKFLEFTRNRAVIYGIIANVCTMTLTFIIPII